MLFRRYALMQAWAASGQIDLERTSPKDRARMAERLHTCLGNELAALVLSGAARR